LQKSYFLYSNVNNLKNFFNNYSLLKYNYLGKILTISPGALL